MKKLLLLFVLLSAVAVRAQFTEFHPEVSWHTISGKYVEVHYHDGAERTARTILKIMDEIWEPICSLYDYEPDRVHFVVKDLDDYSNGATYFFDNKIEIWTSALDFDLRGTHNWLRNVVSHEFTHMVQIQAAMKTSRMFPALYLQWLNYEDKRRPDILYGYPNVIMSYPIPSINMPAWFAEGTAQYMRHELDYDNWDSHRDMILRSYAMDDNMLTWEQMGVFAKTSLGNESVYNSGFALTLYIAQKYGEDKLREITENLGNLTTFSIDGAIEEAVGVDGHDLYLEWRAFLKEHYGKRLEMVMDNLAAGDTIAEVGFGNFYPLISPDGKSVYYVSNKSADYFGQTSLFRYDLETEETESLVPGVRSTYSVIPGTNKLLYSKLTDDNPHSYNVHDLFIYDMDTEEEERLTHNLRANMPSVSNDGAKVTFLFQKDGTTNVGIIDIDGANFRALTNFEFGEQVYFPKFSPDDSAILFGFSYHHGRDIARINVDGTGYEKIIETNADERNASYYDENTIVYASNESGIHNIYRYNLTTGEREQLTNVTGGAFMPSIDKEGNIAYAGYLSGGYKIFYITPEEQMVKDGYDYIAQPNPPLGADKPKGDMAQFPADSLRNFNDYDLPDPEPRDYGGSFTQLSVFPFVRFDNYNTSNNTLEKIKPGLYAFSTDMINRYSMFAGASINSRMERDLFLILEYRNKLPLLFDLGLKPELSIEVYNISRKADVDIEFEEYEPVPTEVDYNLLELDIIARHRFINRFQELELRYIYSSYTATIGSFILPDPNNPQLYPSFNDTYLIGSNFRLLYTYERHHPYIDRSINPIGFDMSLRYDYEMNRFNDEGEYEVADGILKPLYNDYNFHRVEWNMRYAHRLFGNHSLTLRLRGASILGPTVPDFFDFYLGGIVGMKAYPFYAVSGNELFWANLTYRFPLFKQIDTRIGHIYLDKVFLSLYGDVGDAWTGDTESVKLKKGAGAELRVQMTSFYLFPTSLFVNAAYGFDEHTRFSDDGVPVTYGKEWRFYAGLLFGFDL